MLQLPTLPLLWAVVAPNQGRVQTGLHEVVECRKTSASVYAGLGRRMRRRRFWVTNVGGEELGYVIACGGGRYG